MTRRKRNTFTIKAISVDEIDSKDAEIACNEINAHLNEMWCSCINAKVHDIESNYGIKPTKTPPTSMISFTSFSWCCKNFHNRVYQECITQLKERFPDKKLNFPDYSFDDK
jgi:hypothetical protein